MQIVKITKADLNKDNFTKKTVLELTINTKMFKLKLMKI